MLESSSIGLVFNLCLDLASLNRIRYIKSNLQDIDKKDYKNLSMGLISQWIQK